MTHAINHALRHHDRAIANAWACATAGMVMVLADAGLSWVAGDELGIVGLLLALLILVMSVSQVSRAVQQARDAGANARMVRDAGCLQLAKLYEIDRSTRRRIAA